MSDPLFEIGHEVFIHNPQRFDPECKCIIGVIHARAWWDGRWRYRFINECRGTTSGAVWHDERDMGHRVGTPISQLSGRPGHPGYDRFVAIAASWGYD